jgi:PGF-CTERM protein
MRAHTSLLLAGLLVLSGTAVFGAAAAPHDSKVDGYRVNFTWTPSAQFGSDNHAPGKPDASYEAYTRAYEPGRITELDYIIVSSEALDMSQCNPLDARSLGIDRDDDDPGTKTDESLTDHLEENSFSEDRILLKFFDEGDLAGKPVSIRDEDQIVSATSACFGNPAEPGWYRVRGLLNGSAVDPEGEREYKTFDVYSHYFYICECDSEQEAYDTLGPRPSKMQNGSGDAESTTTASPEATTTRSATAAETRTRSATRTRTRTATVSVSRTATVTATRTATGGPTVTRTRTATVTVARTDAAATTSRTETATRTVRNDRAGQSRTGGDVPTTPTVGDGPGFGAVATLVGLVTARLLARRRR